MQQQTRSWPPVIGDHARIKGSPFAGEIVKTKGVTEPRYRVKVSGTTAAGLKLPPAQARAARVASRWYGLDELESPE